VVREAMALSGLGYDAFRERNPLALSGGERRKVAFAGILAMQPAYVLLDEPTAGLDYPARKVIYQTIKGLQEKQIGVLLVSHRPQDLLQLADRIIMLKAGRLVLDQETMPAVEKIEHEDGGYQPVTPSREVMYRLNELGWQIPAPIKTVADLAQAVGERLLSPEVGHG
jgi:energy-coupling factor transport system ATP-binding protein